MSIFDDADKAGQELRAKLDAQKAAKAAAQESGKAAAAKQKQHEEDQKQGMIDL